jgi:hypothetical protein
MHTPKNKWCLTQRCDKYKAPEQLCEVCRAVDGEIRLAVKLAVQAEKDRILRELPGVFGR